MAKYQNSQLYQECQLVTLWNAARFHGITDLPVPGTELYYQICYDSGGTNGGCISIRDEIQRLEMRCIEGPINLQWVRRNLPVSFSLLCWEGQPDSNMISNGYHSVLAVAVKGNRVTLANYARGRLHHMEWRALKKMQNKHVKLHSIIPMEDE